MTKFEGRIARAGDPFREDGAQLIREEPETKRVYDLEERTERYGLKQKNCISSSPKFGEISSRLTTMRTSKASETKCRLRHSNLVIPSSFDIRISSFFRI